MKYRRGLFHIKEDLLSSKIVSLFSPAMRKIKQRNKFLDYTAGILKREPGAKPASFRYATDRIVCRTSLSAHP